jgi:DNA-binding CsgD family transcriptional regulator
MTVAVPPMSSPITIRDIAPHWQITCQGPDVLETAMKALCDRHHCNGAIMFAIRNCDATRDVRTLASYDIDPVLTDAVVERTTRAVAQKGNPQTMPMIVPAWRIGGTPAYIYAFPDCQKAHGQMVSAYLSVEKKEFAEVAEMFLATRCIMDGADTVRDKQADTDQPRISTREQACLAWTAEGKTSEEIGIILELSPHTVNHYLGSAARKLGATNRMHAVAKALRLGLIERPV